MKIHSLQMRRASGSGTGRLPGHPCGHLSSHLVPPPSSCCHRQHSEDMGGRRGLGGCGSGLSPSGVPFCTSPGARPSPARCGGLLRQVGPRGAPGGEQAPAGGEPSGGRMRADSGAGSGGEEAAGRERGSVARRKREHCCLPRARAPCSTSMVGLLLSPGTFWGLLGRRAPASIPQLVQVPLWVHGTPVLWVVCAHASFPGTQGTAAGQCFAGRTGALGSRGVCYLGIAAITWGK